MAAYTARHNPAVRMGGGGGERNKHRFTRGKHLELKKKNPELNVSYNFSVKEQKKCSVASVIDKSYAKDLS